MLAPILHFHLRIDDGLNLRRYLVPCTSELHLCLYKTPCPGQIVVCVLQGCLQDNMWKRFLTIDGLQQTDANWRCYAL